MRIATSACCSLIAIAACSGGDPEPEAASPDAGTGPAPVFADEDQDGLCDRTETELGTNLRAFDTDGDGFPDAQELMAGTNPRDRSNPSADHVGYLAAAAGELDFVAALTVDGSGQAAKGRFASRTALDSAGRRALDYFRGCIDVSAVPADYVRDIDVDAARVGTILGRTRLSYRLRFESPEEPTKQAGCAALLPFDFVITDDSGVYLARQTYALVVSEDGEQPKADQFCRPVSCL